MTTGGRLAPAAAGAVVPVGRLLAVHAHPDDESLSTGALLATWAAAGLPVTVVTCTRGEAGETIGDDLASLEGDREGLAAYRTIEIRAALDALSGTGTSIEHHWLDELPDAHGHQSSARYEDSGMAWSERNEGQATAAAKTTAAGFVAVPLDEAAGRLAALIERERPDVVVTYEPGGGYGHPDHVRTHEVTMAALTRAAATGAHPGAVWWPILDPAAETAALEVVASHGPAQADGHGHRQALSTPASSALRSGSAERYPIVARVPVRPVLGQVAAALRAYRSQVQAVETWDDDACEGRYALSNGVIVPLLSTETYTRAVP